VELSDPRNHKEEATSSLTVRIEEASTTLGNSAPIAGLVLRSEQREQVESKDLANRATGRKVRPSRDVSSTAPGKEIVVGL
jgi:hypothetical protein